MLYTARLKAGIPHQAPVGGRVILVDSTGAANGLDITPMKGGAELRPLPNRQKGFKYAVDFDAVVLKAAVDCDIGIFLSLTDVNLGFVDGMAVKVTGEVKVTNDNANPVPVTLQGSTVNMTATNVGVNNDNAGAVPVKNQALSTIVDVAAKVVGVAAASVSNDATLRRLRFRNSHATAVIALGSSTVTLANSPIRLLPGDVFIEDDAAGANWYAISDTAGASLQVQGVK
jgi:hypothetical protein